MCGRLQRTQHSRVSIPVAGEGEALCCSFPPTCRWGQSLFILGNILVFVFSPTHHFSGYLPMLEVEEQEAAAEPKLILKRAAIMETKSLDKVGICTIMCVHVQYRSAKS